jgi:hypothetical protein
MKTVKVQTPQGEVWQVRVVWQPRWSALVRRFGGWRRKRKGAREGIDALDTASGCDGDLGAIVFGIVLFVVGGLLLWFFLLPLLLLAVDIIVVIVLLAAAIPARVLLRRPWTVEAVTDDGQNEKVFSVDIVGWRRALETRDDIADKLGKGVPAPVVGTLRTTLIAPPH